MNPEQIDRAAAAVVDGWLRDAHFDALPDGAAPAHLDDGYAVQARFAERLGTLQAGWKLACTNVAGQRHVNVGHPLVGRLFADRVYPSPATIALRANGMRVAEAEFCFRIGLGLAPGDAPLERDEIMAAVDALYPAVELPDSRFVDFARAGAAALAADNACAREFVLGAEVTGRWRDIAFERYPVAVYRNGERAVEGTGGDVLGDPRDALAWFVNECRRRGLPLKSGQLVTTGVVGAPVPIAAGDTVRADFGMLGEVSVTFADLPAGRPHAANPDQPDSRGQEPDR